MKKMILASAILIGCAFQAQAAATMACTPTSTVEEARARYDEGLRLLDAKLGNEFNLAQQQLEEDYAVSYTNYQARVKEINEKYDSEFAQIRNDLNPGWNQALREAIIRQNADLVLANGKYEEQNQIAREGYHNRTEIARAEYSDQARQLADDYNRAVCAG